MPTEAIAKRPFTNQDRDTTAPCSSPKSAIIRQFWRPRCRTHQALSHPARGAAAPGQEGTAGARSPCPAAIPSLFRTARCSCGNGAWPGPAAPGSGGRGGEGNGHTAGEKEGQIQLDPHRLPSPPLSQRPPGPRDGHSAVSALRSPGQGDYPAGTRGLPSPSGGARLRGPSRSGLCGGPHP